MKSFPSAMGKSSVQSSKKGDLVEADTPEFRQGCVIH